MSDPSPKIGMPRPVFSEVTMTPLQGMGGVVRRTAHTLLFCDDLLARYGLGPQQGALRHALLAPIGLPTSAALPGYVHAEQSGQLVPSWLHTARTALSALKQNSTGERSFYIRVSPQERDALDTVRQAAEMPLSTFLNCLLIREHTEMENRGWEKSDVPLLQYNLTTLISSIRRPVTWRLPADLTMYAQRLRSHYEQPAVQTVFRLLIARAVAEHKTKAGR